MSGSHFLDPKDVHLENFESRQICMVLVKYLLCVCALKAYIIKHSFYWNGTKAKILASYFQSDAKATFGFYSSCHH